MDNRVFEFYDKERKCVKKITKYSGIHRRDDTIIWETEYYPNGNRRSHRKYWKRSPFQYDCDNCNYDENGNKHGLEQIYKTFKNKVYKQSEKTWEHGICVQEKAYHYNGTLAFEYHYNPNEVVKRWYQFGDEYFVAELKFDPQKNLNDFSVQGQYSSLFSRKSGGSYMTTNKRGIQDENSVLKFVDITTQT